MVSIELHRNNAYPWYHHNGIHAKGYLFNEANLFLEGKQLIHHFSKVKSSDEFQSKLKKSSGLFSVIIETEDAILFAVDIIRMFPLFWFQHEEKIVLTDDLNISRIKYHLPLENNFHQQQFLATGYMTGNDTLLSGVHQLTAGQSGIINLAGLRFLDYTNFLSSTIKSKSQKALKNTLEELIIASFRRLINQANGRTIAIPLSGGYDSRMIAVMLKKLNYPHVICFTYGRENNPDANISKKVASALDFPWYKVTYNDNLIQGFLHDETFKKYFPYSSNYCAQFFFQEYFAIRELTDKKILTSDTLVVPGHSGDFLAGSHLFSGLKKDLSKRKLAQRLFQKHFILSDTKKFRDEFTENIYRQLEHLQGYSHLQFEQWDWRERQAKYIVNSTNVYNFFGLKHALPMWETSWFEFFRELPFELRFNKKLYNEVCQELFLEYDLNFRDEIQPNIIELSIQELKDRIKPSLSPVIRLLPKKRKLDLHYYNEITALLTNQMKNKGIEPYQKSTNPNSIVAQWYLSQIH